MVKTFSKGLRFAAAGLIFASALSACADIDDNGTSSSQQKVSINSTQTQVMDKTVAESSDDNVIKIGAVFPLTGDGAAYGEPMQKVAQIALDEINEKAGEKGKKLEFIWQDGKCNGNDASTAANKLINVDKVKVIYGGFCSSETLAMAPIAEAAHVIILSPASSSPDITNAGDYIFRNYPSDATQGMVLAEGAKAQGFKKVAVLAEQNDYTVGIQKVFENKFKELGGEVLVATYLPDDADFRSTLLKLKADGADALLVDPQTPAKADLIFKQLEEMKWDVHLMGNDVVAGYQDLIAKYSKLVEGMIVAEFSYNKENPDFKKLAEKYKEKNGKELPYGTYATTSYDAVYIVNEAVNKVGNDADAVKEYLKAIKDRKGLGGVLNFDEHGDPKAGHVLEVVQGGKVTMMK